MNYCHSAPSVDRPSSGVNFHIFDFFSETAEWNSTKLKRKQDLNALYQVCVFRADRKNKMAALVSDWLSHFGLLLWNGWMEFNETWQEARSQPPLPSLCFSGRSEKQDGRPGLWLAETFSTSSLKPLNRIQWNLTQSKISMPSTKFVFFGLIGKRRWPPWPLIGWDIFNFSETAEQNSTKLDRKQDLNALYQVCVFRADQINKMAALASDWLRHFWLLLWNRWTEFNETWQEARSQSPLPSLCFSGWSKKQDGCLGLWLAETFSTSPLKPPTRIQRNLIGSKILTPSIQFVFFGPIGKTKWPPWPLIGWDIFDFSSETTEPNSRKLNRKQDLNAFYQVCVFQADRKNKMAALAYDLLRHFQLFLWNRWIEFNKTWQEARSQHLLPGLRFSGRSEQQDSCPVLWLAETFSTSPMKPLNGIQWNLTENKFSTSSTKFVFLGWSIKQYGRPDLWFAETYFDFSSETAERNSAKLDRKQDLNIIYLVCVFQAKKCIKIATLANPSKKVAHCNQVTLWGPLGLLLVPFWCHLRDHCTQVSDSGPHGPLVYISWRIIIKLIQSKSLFL